MLPMNQVSADGMPPVHGSPYIAIGIVLVEEVVLPFIEDHAIGIVRPHGIGAKMELGTVLFGVAELRDPGFIIFLCGTRRKEEWRADQQSDQDVRNFQNIMILSLSIKGPEWYPSPCW